MKQQTLSGSAQFGNTTRRAQFLADREQIDPWPGPAVEEALYHSGAMRSLVGIDPGIEGTLQETTVCKLRHLLEWNQLAKTLLPTRMIARRRRTCCMATRRGSGATRAIKAEPPSFMGVPRTPRTLQTVGIATTAASMKSGRRRTTLNSPRTSPGRAARSTRNLSLGPLSSPVLESLLQ